LWTYKDQFCLSSLDEKIEGPTTAEECFAACGKKYPDRPNFAQFVEGQCGPADAGVCRGADKWFVPDLPIRRPGGCTCRDSCGCIGFGEGVSTITAEPFSEMPPTCCSINRKYGVEKCVDGNKVVKYGCVAHTIKDFIDLERQPVATLDCVKEVVTRPIPWLDCFKYPWLGDMEKTATGGATWGALQKFYNRTALDSLREGVDSLYLKPVCMDGGDHVVELAFFTSREDCLATESPAAAIIEPVESRGSSMEDYFCPAENKDAPSAGLRRKLHGSSPGSSKLWLRAQLEPTASEP